MTILFIMLVQAVPVYLIARIFKDERLVALSAIILAVLAVVTGSAAYAVLDLVGIAVAYWLGIGYIRDVPSKRTPPSLLPLPATIPPAPDAQSSASSESATVRPENDTTSVEFRHKMLGSVHEGIHEQFAVLLAAMHVHLALETAMQFGSFENQAKAVQEEWINEYVIKGLERNQYQPTFLRRQYTRYVFDLYREAYIAVANLVPPWERGLSMVQYKMAVTAADFLKNQFLKEGHADICTFLNVTTRARNF